MPAAIIPAVVSVAASAASAGISKSMNKGKGGSAAGGGGGGAVQMRSSADIMNEAINRAKQEHGLAYGAREGALADLAKGTQFYESFQPTSIEQALGNQYFQNVMPEAERGIKAGLSMSGLEYSPLLGEQLGMARGKLGYDVGSYLSNLGNDRARYSLSSRMAIDPTTTYMPAANLASDLERAQAGYNNAEAERQFRAQQDEIAYQRQNQGNMGAMAGSLLNIGAGLLSQKAGGTTFSTPPGYSAPSISTPSGYGGSIYSQGTGTISPFGQTGYTPMPFDTSKYRSQTASAVYK